MMILTGEENGMATLKIQWMSGGHKKWWRRKYRKWQRKQGKKYLDDAPTKNVYKGWM